MIKLISSFFKFIKIGNDKKAGIRVKFILKLLREIKYGELKLVTPEGENFIFSGSENPDLIKADLTLFSWDAINATFTKGDVGFGEAFMKDQWSSSNLTNLFELISLNSEVLNNLIHGRKLLLLYEWFSHRLKFNSKINAKSNIRAHYDLSNSFYGLFLDPSMTYSSAFYGANEKLTLEEAQKKKYQQVISIFQNFEKNSRILEIGCGWGGFAKLLLRETSANYLGITLSKNQYDYVSQQIINEDNRERANFQMLDYRNVDGNFDGIVSIEMFEAVGEAYWSKYFQTIKNSLKPKGKALIQTILINESKYKKYKKGVDFIQTYVFPGGMLACESVFKNEIKEAELKIINELWFSLDYAKTLQNWQILFEKNIRKIEELGLNKKFCNMWRFYLAYCEAGFKTGDLEVVQFTLEN